METTFSYLTNERSTKCSKAEFCLCVPFINAAFERFFSQMRIVKTGWRNKLNEKNLSSLFYIKTQGPTLTEFHDNYCSPTVNLWVKTDG